MALYFDDIYDIKNPHLYSGRIYMYIPTITDEGGTSYSSLAGSLISEISVGGGNKWGPILEKLSALTEISTLMQLNEVFSWIGASAQCWKETEPLKLNLDFYVVNYKPGLGIEKNLKDLLKLTSLTKGTWGEAAMVKIHGGYNPKPLTENSALFSIFDQDYKNLHSSFKEYANENFNRESYYSPGYYTGIPGTVMVFLGNNLQLGNLLVSRAEVTPSLIEVCDTQGENIKPLYYRVSVSLVGALPILSNEVDMWFSTI